MIKTPKDATTTPAQTATTTPAQTATTTPAPAATLAESPVVWGPTTYGSMRMMRFFGDD